jgi:hypothetical protein
MSNNTITNCTNANMLNSNENTGTLQNNVGDGRGNVGDGRGNVGDGRGNVGDGRANATITNCTQASNFTESPRRMNSHHHMLHQESNVNQDSDEESSELHCKKKEIGLVLCCTDHRFINKTFEFLKDHPTSTFNYIILSGASLGYNTGSECWKNTFLDHVDLAIKTNNINKIIVIDHDNCTSYNSHYNDLEKDPDLEDEYHYINMLKFKKEMKKFYPELTVFTHLLK